MTDEPDYYELLEVSPNASPEVIDAAYRSLVARLGADPDPAVRERRREVEAAYAVLSNRERRAAYDARRNGASRAPAEPAAAAAAPPPGMVVACPRDPGVETALRCSRCGTPICPKCLIQTPVGARCRDCARMARNPIYTLTAGGMARAAVASLVGGVVMGVAWGVVLLPFTFGFFAIFVGAGLGYAFTRVLEAATGNKRGPAVVSFAIAGILVAWGVMVLIVPQVWAYGLLPAGIAAYLAYHNLR
ncbi:DnaJ domain-containing protein [Tepidiforma sp.]|uniref:DnaJ domain-containing protein n=1 Tax=Tepidiforma sp. TaxID=2682230 RepID=UPI002ADDED84|nr:DnaJ domain-containing protein [Tepidiforma sp.]